MSLLYHILESMKESYPISYSDIPDKKVKCGTCHQDLDEYQICISCDYCKICQVQLLNRDDKCPLCDYCGGCGIESIGCEGACRECSENVLLET